MSSKRRATSPGRRFPTQKRQVSPDQTNAENFYYVKQMQSKTPMVITLKDGEVLKGVIEWYDRSCLKLGRDGAPKSRFGALSSVNGGILIPFFMYPTK
jgi:hypothetical protein